MKIENKTSKKSQIKKEDGEKTIYSHKSMPN